MKRAFFCVVCLTCLLLPSRGLAQLIVDILDAPASAYSFEPVWVTFEVRNEGEAPAVLPAGPCPREGGFLVAGRRGSKLEPQWGRSDCSNEFLVWLQPGGRWLFYQPVALGPEGVFELEAVLQSPGDCHGRPVGPNRHQIEPARAIEWGARPFDCWPGEARSQRIEVEVYVPRAPVDVAAGELVGEYPIGSPKKLLFNIRDLLSRFPTSHYTYAAFWAGASGKAQAMLNAVILQPDNPLNPWVAGAMARDLLYRNRPCGTPQPWRPGAPDDLDERFDRVIAAYPPPDPVKAYLEQLEAELAAEECPEEAPVGDAPADEGGEP